MQTDCHRERRQKATHARCRQIYADITKTSFHSFLDSKNWHVPRQCLLKAIGYKETIQKYKQCHCHYFIQNKKNRKNFLIFFVDVLFNIILKLIFHWLSWYIQIFDKIIGTIFPRAFFINIYPFILLKLNCHFMKCKDVQYS